MLAVLACGLILIPGKSFAGLSTYVGSFASNTATGSQAYTGVGFQPSVIIFFMNNETSDTSGLVLSTCYGFAVSSSDRRSVTATLINTVNGSWSGHDDSKCISIISSVPTVISAADFTSMDSDGFTLNWTTADATARIVNYVALGGTNVTNVKTGQFTSPTSASSAAVTGVGFQPDSVILMEQRDTATAPPSNLSSVAYNQLGFGLSSSSQASSSMGAGTSGADVNNSNYQRTDKIFSATSIAGAVFREANLTSMDSDGFTLNWSTVQATARYVHYLAIKGPSFSIGSFNQATATGAQSVSGLSTAPAAIIFNSVDAVTSSTPNAGSGARTIGLASDSTHRGNIWQDPGNTATHMNEILSRSTVLTMAHSTGIASYTVDAQSDFTSMDATGFTVNWSTADATAREILYLAIGTVAGGSTQADKTIHHGFEL